jgi:hypothetical protein
MQEFLPLSVLDAEQVRSFQKEVACEDGEHILQTLGLVLNGRWHPYRGFNRFLRQSYSLPPRAKGWKSEEETWRADWQREGSDTEEKTYEAFEATARRKARSYARRHCCDPTATIFRAPNPHPLQERLEEGFRLWRTVDNGGVGFVVCVKDGDVCAYGRTDDVVMGEDEPERKEPTPQEVDDRHAEEAKDLIPQTREDGKRDLEGLEEKQAPETREDGKRDDEGLEEKQTAPEDGRDEEEEDWADFEVGKVPEFVTLIGRWEAEEVFVGTSERNTMTEFSGGHGPSWNGNSFLLRVGRLSYVHIGISICSFTTDEPITSYVSSVGNNAVTYPYAESATWCYSLWNAAKTLVSQHPDRQQRGFITDFADAQYLDLDNWEQLAQRDSERERWPRRVRDDYLWPSRSAGMIRLRPGTLVAHVPGSALDGALSA